MKNAYKELIIILKLFSNNILYPDVLWLGFENFAILGPPKIIHKLK
jgi:hypothetical protein